MRRTVSERSSTCRVAVLIADRMAGFGCDRNKLKMEELDRCFSETILSKDVTDILRGGSR